MLIITWYHWPVWKNPRGDKRTSYNG